MRSPPIGFGAALGLCAVLAVPAEAQIYPGYTPGSYALDAPSTRLGPSPLRDLGAPNEIGSLPAGGFGGDYFGGFSGGSGLLPTALLPSTRGLAGFAPYSGAGISQLEMPNARELSNITGYDAMLSFGSPIGGWPKPKLPQLETPLYADYRPPSAFHAFFGLERAKPLASPESESIQPIESWASALEEQNNKRLAEMAGRAIEAFKQATTRDAQERDEKLARAIHLLLAVGRLDPGLHMPSVLTVHAALLRGHHVLAFRTLFQVADRAPGYFYDRPDVAQYYGDPAIFDEAMRRNLRLGEEERDAPAAFVLQAYCCWMLNDFPRAKSALARAEELSVGLPEQGGVKAFRLLLETAMNQAAR